MPLPNDPPCARHDLGMARAVCSCSLPALDAETAELVQELASRSATFVPETALSAEGQADLDRRSAEVRARLAALDARNAEISARLATLDASPVNRWRAALRTQGAPVMYAGMDLSASPVHVATDAYYRSEHDPETVARQPVPSDIPGYAEYLAFIAAEGLDGPVDEDGAAPTRLAPRRRRPVERDTHMVVSFPAGRDEGGVWYGGAGHRLLSTDEGVSCYRCGMTAEDSAIQEDIPDCRGPENGGDHHYSYGAGGTVCEYGCRDFTSTCSRD